MQQIKSMGVLVFVLVIFVGFLSLFKVPEAQRALVTKLGKIVTDSETGEAVVYEPGLHIKLPFVTQTFYFDKRLQTLVVEQSRVITNEKKEVIVSYFIKWRIRDFPLFYRSTNGDRLKAEILLQQKADDGLRTQFGLRTIAEVVAGERADIMLILRKEIDESAAALGIEVRDVRTKKIDLPPQVSESVYLRMRTERQQVAAEYRAGGEREAEIIRADSDAKVTILLAEADKNSKVLRGEGDAEAAQIYAKAYGADPEFFAFYKSLEAYRYSFDSKNDIFVLNANNDFFKYFQAAKDK